MKKAIIKSALLISGIMLCLSLFSVSVSAASFEDVIAYAREAGVPEEQIQNGISLYGGKEWTSEQCDEAIANMNRMGFTRPIKPAQTETNKTEVNTDELIKPDKFKELDSAQQADVISGMLGIGKNFGYNFLIEDVSDDSIIVSVRDEKNKLVGMTILGNTIEKTGITYTYSILTALALMLFSAVGMAIAVGKCGDRK